MQDKPGTQLRFTSLIKRALFSLFVVVYAVLSGCSEQAVIKIGFIGSLTGKMSDLGTSGRDGVALAIKEINESGGINGSRLELIVVDDNNNEQAALAAVRELIKNDVSAVIGSMTSSMSMAIYPELMKHQIVMISPTTSSDWFTGKDDHFIRLSESSNHQAYHMAEYALNTAICSNVGVIVDLSNKPYTMGLLEAFKSRFEDELHHVGPVITYNANEDTSLKKIASQLLEAENDCYFIAACSLDAAMLCQQIALLGGRKPTFLSSWAKTNDFIQYGGINVEGVIFSQSFNPESNDENQTRFNEIFTNEYGREPNFASIAGYDTAMVLARALKQNPDSKALKQTILDIKTYETAQGTLRFDQYGDPIKERFIHTVKSGKYTLKN